MRAKSRLAALPFAYLLAFSCSTVLAQPWVADLGNGFYKNPVLFADYSDPDVIRVGGDYYLTSSSFNCVPALPILHSRDLVNWSLIGHAVERLPERFDTVQHGNGIWAPSIRYHDGWFWIFVGDPDWGILMTRSRKPTGPWEPLHVVQAGKGLIDPCPLWDDDGKAYLVHAYANSRSGRKSIIVGREMSLDGRRLIGEEHLLIDGRDNVHPTIEGPKFYKRDGWYYVLAPAGGVKPGWQLAARARKPFGPYEVRRVMEQGSTDINGPHQGGWVETTRGEHWFMHFQDRDAYGRLVHLNPVRWKDGWPEMGKDLDGNGIGEPVTRHPKPEVKESVAVSVPQTSDDFENGINLAWQWQANPQPNWTSTQDRPGWLRLYAQPLPQSGDLTSAPHALLQKFCGPEFTATAKLELSDSLQGAEMGLVVMGLEYAGVLVSLEADRLLVRQITGKQGEDYTTTESGIVAHGPLWLRVDVATGPECRFAYSTNGKQFQPLGKPFTAQPGRWIGAKVGLVCLGEQGSAEVDWFRIE